MSLSEPNQELVRSIVAKVLGELKQTTTIKRIVGDPSAPAPGADRDAAKRTARQLLRKNWGKVKALAEALMVTPIIRTERIKEIVEHAAPATCQPVAANGPLPIVKRFTRDEQGDIAVMEEWQG